MLFDLLDCERIFFDLLERIHKMPPNLFTIRRKIRTGMSQLSSEHGPCMGLSNLLHHENRALLVLFLWVERNIYSIKETKRKEQLSWLIALFFFIPLSCSMSILVELYDELSLNQSDT